MYLTRCTLQTRDKNDVEVLPEDQIIDERMFDTTIDWIGQDPDATEDCGGLLRKTDAPHPVWHTGTVPNGKGGPVAELHACHTDTCEGAT